MTLRLFAIISMIAVAMPVAHAASIVNHENLPVPTRSDGSKFSAVDVETLIAQGCSLRKWSPVIESDGVITCSILVRGKHFAKVQIPFSATSYSILYLDSNNLNYSASRNSIHRNYNKWVSNLAQMISRQFADARLVNGDSAPASTGSSAADDDRYEALLKLGELREKGIISEEEFQAEKEKLLNQAE